MQGNRDITDMVLQEMYSISSDMELLANIVNISRENFGFFTKHTSRSIEYVWVLQRITDIKNKYFFDIGAGINPLPLYLAEKEGYIYTVDYSTNIRVYGEDMENWSEWGYMDYHKLSNNILSFNEDINDLVFQHKFDCIYSVSVIEHMPASSRRLLLEKVNEYLNDNGELILTIDLYKGTEDLWNYNDGIIVEAVKDHGNLEALKEELNKYFLVKEEEIFRDIPHIDKIDVVCLYLVKK